MHKLRFYRNEEYEIFKYIKKCNSLLFIRCRETRIDENLTNNHFLRIGRFSISIPRMKNSAPSNFPPLLSSKIFCILFISSIYIYISARGQNYRFCHYFPNSIQRFADLMRFPILIAPAKWVRQGGEYESGLAWNFNRTWSPIVLNPYNFLIDLNLKDIRKLSLRVCTQLFCNESSSTGCVLNRINYKKKKRKYLC